MKRDTLRNLAACVCSAVVVLGSAARAVDGVNEINDASIIAAGGYPAVIGVSGSYVLTSNLTPPVGSNAIDVFAPDVTIDLNGFQINGFGAGATGISGLGANLSVHNGTITGFGGVGISTAFGAKIHHVQLTGNPGTAIVSAGCLIVENTIITNGAGISADRCKIENNIVQSQGGPGITGGANVIAHNLISDNVGGGILTFAGSTIQENVINMNGAFGVSDGILGPPPPAPPPAFPERVNVRGNTIHGNGMPLGGPGISFTMPVLIAQNTVSGNAGSGIVCGPGCTVSGNLIDSNNLLALPASGGVLIGDGGNVTENTISFNTGIGLFLTPLTGYSQNTLNANVPGPDAIGPHPTAGFMNLCSGLAGPAPTCL